MTDFYGDGDRESEKKEEHKIIIVRLNAIILTQVVITVIYIK